MDTKKSSKTTVAAELPKRNPKTGRFEKSAVKHTTAAKPPVATAKAPVTTKPVVKPAKKP